VPAPPILLGDVGGHAEHLRGVQREVGMAQEFARQQHQVGLLRTDDLIGLLRRGDQPDGAGENAGLAADALGKGNLIARSRAALWRGADRPTNNR
jgi:hypothetical protein